MSEVRIRWLESAASTQDEAHQFAATGAPHGSAIAVPVQTAGRGTRGRVWISSEGGLWLSVVCRPARGSAVEVVGVRTGLALARFLDGIVRPPARIALKWPNDLLLGTGKLGGILTEARWQGDELAWIIVGVGLNVRNDLPKGTAPPAARLLDAGVSLAAVDLAEPVARVVARATRSAEPLSPDELEEFRLRDWLRGRRLKAPEAGTAEGISAAGLLRIRRGDGSMAEVFGSVGLAAPDA
ncbi:MAG TPA: biotin--[acetyl-CoA-carboxylase] ligase [Gemmatimonadales bacterium]|jgi:BirA family biotin operon repressor/biotin-[acetyl-CoA-carboxylase] ligase|nr:biotin--[acetyl-CoA-carboxylase] ligase [Gemmatimonadales bacterium]